MSKRIAHREKLACGIVLAWGPFEWFAHNCQHRHAYGTDIPFADCRDSETRPNGGDCCYRFCKRYKRCKSNEKVEAPK